MKYWLLTIYVLLVKQCCPKKHASKQAVGKWSAIPNLLKCHRKHVPHREKYSWVNNRCLPAKAHHHRRKKSIDFDIQQNIPRLMSLTISFGETRSAIVGKKRYKLKITIKRGWSRVATRTTTNAAPRCDDSVECIHVNIYPRRLRDFNAREH